jgi:Leucine Rich repeat
MEEQQRQQQQQQPLHSAVVNGIARLADPRYSEEERRELYVAPVFFESNPNVDRRSLHHLVDFLDNVDSHEVVITELRFYRVKLVSDPSDGGVVVLRDFFARSDTTLTTVTLDRCDFGSQQDAEQLLAAFHTNRTITDIKIHRGVANLQGIARGNPLFDLLQNIPQLQRLDLSGSALNIDAIRAFQPALRVNRSLKQLHLENCALGDGGIRLIADALVGNTTIELLNIRYNNITSVGLDDITHMIGSTQLKTIFSCNGGIFNDQDATQRFVTTLQQKRSSIQELPWFSDYLHGNIRAAMNACIKLSLIRNQQLNRVALLLVPPPPPLQRRQQQQHATSMMLKISHKAIAKFATVPNNATGASAIFKLLQARPALLEKRIKRPAAATATSSSLYNDDAGIPSGSNHRRGKF